MNPASLAFLLLLGLLGALPPLSIDVVTPALLASKQALGTTQSTIGLVITLFMCGFAAGQFWAGSTSDAYGRRPVLLAGLSSYVAASIACGLATNIGILLAARAVQGAGAGACMVLTFAMIRDLYQGDAARSRRSYLTVIFGVAPMLAPLLGAWLSGLAGWRAVYAALTVLGVSLLLVVAAGLPESRRASSLPGGPFARSWGRVLSDRGFVGSVVLNSFSYAAVFTYIAASPFVFIGSFGLSPVLFGTVFAAGAAALTSGAMVSGRCVRRGVRCHVLLRWSLGGGAIAGLLLLPAFLMEGAAWWLVLPPLFGTMFCRGIASPNIQHLALEPMQDFAGTAAAALGIAQIMSGALASGAVVSLYAVWGASAMGILMALFTTVAALLWLRREGAAPAV